MCLFKFNKFSQIFKCNASFHFISSSGSDILIKLLCVTFQSEENSQHWISPTVLQLYWLNYFSSVLIHSFILPRNIISSRRTFLLGVLENGLANGSAVFPRWMHGVCGLVRFVFDVLRCLSVLKNTRILAEMFWVQRSRDGTLPR